MLPVPPGSSDGLLCLWPMILSFSGKRRASGGMRWTSGGKRWTSDRERWTSDGKRGTPGWVLEIALWVSLYPKQKVTAKRKKTFFV